MDGAPIDTSLYALLIPFDNIGRVGFSTEFGMVRSGRETELLRLLGIGFAAASKLGQMGWPLGVLRSLGLTADEDKLNGYINELIEKRIAVGLSLLRHTLPGDGGVCVHCSIARRRKANLPASTILRTSRTS